MKRGLIIIVAVCILAAAGAGSFYLGRDTVLEFQVQDSLTGSWIWDMEASIQEKVLSGYYQSDRGLITFRFTGLSPGNSMLSISAPAYENMEIPVTLKRGVNRIEEPIELTALEIPELHQFYAFEDYQNQQWDITLRPISAEHRAIRHHPPVDLYVLLRISSWRSDYEPSFQLLSEQEILYQGPLPWTWDSKPETQFRYRSQLPLAELDPHTNRSYVFEYLILVPDPRRIDSSRLEEIAAFVIDMEVDEISDYIDSFDGAVTLYTDISWDLRR